MKKQGMVCCTSTFVCTASLRIATVKYHMATCHVAVHASPPLPPPPPHQYQGLIRFVCLQHAVDKLIADVAALAAPGSLFHLDFLHLDVLEGRTAAVGYDNTAKASLRV